MMLSHDLSLITISFGNCTSQANEIFLLATQHRAIHMNNFILFFFFVLPAT